MKSSVPLSVFPRTRPRQGSFSLDTVQGSLWLCKHVVSESFDILIPHLVQILHQRITWSPIFSHSKVSGTKRATKNISILVWGKLVWQHNQANPKLRIFFFFFKLQCFLTSHSYPGPVKELSVLMTPFLCEWLSPLTVWLKSGMWPVCFLLSRASHMLAKIQPRSFTMALLSNSLRR